MLNTQVNPYLTFVRKAIREGDLEKARGVLRAMIRRNPGDAENWFLMSAAADSPREAVPCLRRVLRLVPGHSGASELMNQLEAENPKAVGKAMQVASYSAAIGQVCPFCLVPFSVGHEVVTCPSCAASHHLACWKEGGFGCYMGFCEGFTLREEKDDPLPTQPAEEPRDMIVIRKEDLPVTPVASRKKHEQRFQRRLLLQRLLTEENADFELSIDGLPPLEDLLELVQRDLQRSPEAGDSVVPAADPIGEPSGISTWPYQTNSIVSGITPILQEAAGASTLSDEVDCHMCSKRIPDEFLFCPRCGAEQ